MKDLKQDYDETDVDFIDRVYSEVEEKGYIVCIYDGCSQKKENHVISASKLDVDMNTILKYESIKIEILEPDVKYFWDIGTWGDDFPYMTIRRVIDLDTFSI